jgi:hypothetical protein
MIVSIYTSFNILQLPVDDDLLYRYLIVTGFSPPKFSFVIAPVLQFGLVYPASLPEKGWIDSLAI